MKKRTCPIFLSCVQVLKAHLTHNSLSSRQLVEKFLERKIWEQVRPAKKNCSGFGKLMLVVQPFSVCFSSAQQNVYSGEKYGAVTLLTSYRRSDQRLRVEVLNAVNLLPMDSNGKTMLSNQKMCIANCCVTSPDDPVL